MMLPMARTTHTQWLGMDDSTRLFMLNLTEWQCSQALPEDKRPFTPLIVWAGWDEQQKRAALDREEAELERRIEIHNERENPSTVTTE